MTKRDFQAIARAFFAARPISAERTGPGSDWQRAIDTMANTFADINPRFNRHLFLEACETGKCKGMKV